MEFLVHWNFCQLFFYQFFIFSPNDSPSKTMKSIFYFIEKALFVFKIFKFLWLFPFVFTLFWYKRSNGIGKFMSWIGLHKFADVIFETTQQPLYITSSNLVRWYRNNKGIFLNLFCNLKSDWSLGRTEHWSLGSEEKIKFTFLLVFDNLVSKYRIF